MMKEIIVGGITSVVIAVAAYHVWCVYLYLTMGSASAHHKYGEHRQYGESIVNGFINVSMYGVFIVVLLVVWYIVGRAVFYIVST
jgi:hypothetical protein